MSYEQIIIYGLIFLLAIKIFLFFRKIYLTGRERYYKSRFLCGYRSKKTKDLYREKKQKKLHLENQIDPLQVYREDPEIVDIAKPVGQWTKMVIFSNGLMRRLAQLIQKEGGEKGFWQLFVKAQASAQGKCKGRGK
ncbi:MAG: hypothetical protein PG978_000726 [Wolbachia endosymbiont of Ctenocephalides felis wCfeF]|nr:MAG: hypothetical protein PG978_000726 [Wolbachia endosymbiont of Ctenocephalides felis wCfeF]